MVAELVRKFFKRTEGFLVRWPRPRRSSRPGEPELGGSMPRDVGGDVGGDCDGAGNGAGAGVSDVHCTIGSTAGSSVSVDMVDVGVIGTSETCVVGVGFTLGSGVGMVGIGFIDSC